jgi:copper(I)-binding protein
MQIWKHSISECEIIILVSTAKRRGLNSHLMVGGTSVMHMRKSRGLSIELSETLHFITLFE